MNPSVKMRFTGLMKHLKHNTAFQDRQKQVLFKEQGELLVPDEFDEVLHSEFERRCAYGERLNSELMNSAKWVKLLRELGVSPAFGKDICLFQRPEGEGQSSPTEAGAELHGSHKMITRAEADIIFHKVVHNCDHGGQRLTYELFCKALCLVAQALWPDMEEEQAFSQILNRVIAITAPEPEEANRAIQDAMLNANVLLVLEHFKPQLHELFTAFCHRNLGNPAAANVGMGAVRIRERTIWKHTQDTIMQSSMMSRGGVSDGCTPRTPHRKEAGSDSLGETPSTDQGSPNFGGGGRSPRADSFASLQSQMSPSLFPLRAWAEGGTQMSIAESIDRLRSPRSTMNGSPKAEKKDPYIYANGAPVIRNRTQFMSCDQFLKFCKDFRVLPDLLSRFEVVKIFKRAQMSGLVSSNGASLHGYLSRETFVDACGQVAVEAYSKEPFCDEYPEIHEKIFGFFLMTLPNKKKGKHLKDQFMYGRT